MNCFLILFLFLSSYVQFNQIARLLCVHFVVLITSDWCLRIHFDISICLCYGAHSINASSHSEKVSAVRTHARTFSAMEILLHSKFVHSQRYRLRDERNMECTLVDVDFWRNCNTQPQHTHTGGTIDIGLRFACGGGAGNGETMMFHINFSYICLLTLGLNSCAWNSYRFHYTTATQSQEVRNSTNAKPIISTIFFRHLNLFGVRF